MADKVARFRREVWYAEKKWFQHKYGHVTTDSQRRGRSESAIAGSNPSSWTDRTRAYGLFVANSFWMRSPNRVAPRRAWLRRVPPPVRGPLMGHESHGCRTRLLAKSCSGVIISATMTQGMVARIPRA